MLIAEGKKANVLCMRHRAGSICCISGSEGKIENKANILYIGTIRS